MNSNNFTAQELTSLQTSADNLFKEIVEAIKGVRDACQHMSGVVKSEDSGLATAWDNVAQAILDPVTKAESSLAAVGKSLKSYVDQTVANEQSAEADLGGIDEELGALGQLAGGLVDLGATIGGAAAGVAAGAVGQAVANGAAGGAKDPGSIPGNGTISGGSITHDIPPVIYAPPTPSAPTAVGGTGTVTPPPVIYAPPTPGVSGGVGVVNPPSVIYAPPTPSAPVQVTK